MCLCLVQDKSEVRVPDVPIYSNLGAAWVTVRAFFRRLAGKAIYCGSQQVGFEESLSVAGVANAVPIPPMKGKSLPTAVVKMRIIGCCEHGVMEDLSLGAGARGPVTASILLEYDPQLYAEEFDRPHKRAKGIKPTVPPRVELPPRKIPKLIPKEEVVELEEEPTERGAAKLATTAGVLPF